METPTLRELMDEPEPVAWGGTTRGNPRNNVMVILLGVIRILRVRRRVALERPGLPLTMSSSHRTRRARTRFPS